MASVQAREHSDGTTTWRVRWRQDSRDRSLTFVDGVSAESFKRNVETYGPAEAFRIIDLIDNGIATLTLAQWLTSYAESLTGIEPGTRTRYRRYIERDFAEMGAMPLAALTDTTIARWVNQLDDAGVAGKTIANKHGFLAAALAAAVGAKKIATNPCDKTRLPRKDSDEMCFLTRAEFDILHDHMTPRWQPLTRFLVASGARFSEATALNVGDVDPIEGTVRISKAWKYTGRSTPTRVGGTKTRKGMRTINVPASVISILDLDRPADALLFPTQAGDPIRVSLYHQKAWNPALAKIKADKDGPQLAKRPRPHDLRHTCASWMIQAGVPLPVIQDHLGHESITTTVQVYGHLDRSSAKAAADAIGKILD